MIVEKFEVTLKGQRGRKNESVVDTGGNPRGQQIEKYVKNFPGKKLDKERGMLGNNMDGFVGGI